MAPIKIIYIYNYSYASNVGIYIELKMRNRSKLTQCFTFSPLYPSPSVMMSSKWSPTSSGYRIISANKIYGKSKAVCMLILHL